MTAIQKTMSSNRQEKPMQHQRWLHLLVALWLVGLWPATAKAADFGPVTLEGPIEAALPNLWLGASADPRTVLTLRANVQNASNLSFFFEAPDDVFVDIISVATNSTGATWNTTRTMVNQDPWRTTASGNAIVTASSVYAEIEFRVYGRNGAFKDGQNTNFTVTVTADGDSVQRQHSVRWRSSPSLELQNGANENSSYAWTGVRGGVAGMYVRRTTIVRESGNGRVESGGQLTLDIPAPVRFVSASSSTLADSSAWNITSTPPVDAAGSIAATWPTMRGRAPGLSGLGALPHPVNGSGPWRDTASLHTTTFTPCSGGEPPETTIAFSGVHHGETGDGYDDQSVVLNASGTDLVEAGVQCNTARSQKSINGGGSTRSPGHVIPWVLTGTGQVGVDGDGNPIYPTNAVFVDRLPTDAVELTTAVLVTNDIRFSTSFQLHLCVAPAIGGTFDYATFADLGDNNTNDPAGYCRPEASFGALAPATHVVAYAPSWVDTTPEGPGILPVRVTLSATVRATAPTGTYNNRACVHGALGAGAIGAVWSPDGGGVFPPSPPACVASQFTVTNDLRAAISIISDQNLYNQGESVRFDIGVDATTGILQFDGTSNTAIVITLPAGLVVTSAQQYRVCSGRSGFDFIASWSGNTVTFTPQVAFSADQCGGIGGQGTTASIAAFEILATVSTTWPWLAETPYTATATATVANTSLGVGQTNPFSNTASFEVSAPSFLTLEPLASPCNDQRFEVTMTLGNVGGNGFDDVALTVLIPDGADVTSVSGVINDLYELWDPDPIFIIEYSPDMVSWSTTPDPTAVAVRLFMVDFPGQIEAALTLTLTPSTPGFLSVTGLVTDTGGDLLDTTVDLDASTCEGQIIVAKTFGADGPPMANIDFTATHDTDVVTETTDASGHATVLLPPGIWTLAEVAATLPGSATWTSSWPNGTTFEVTALGTLMVPVVNTCACATCFSCNIEGACLPTPGVACDDGDNDACTLAACNGAGACAPAGEVDCGQTMVDACTADCNAATGACDVPVIPDDCDPGWIFFIAVVDSNGDPDAIRCVAYPDADPVCDPVPVGAPMCSAGQGG
jgi:hypothetical protein